MEFLGTQLAMLFTSLIFFLSLPSSLLFSQLPPISSQAAISPSGTIQRTTKQQILASIPPKTEENSQPFITSPSGKYTGYLLRRETALGAGGFGNDFCYVQVQDASTGQGVWESDCSPVSDVNACSLVFSEEGLEVFDGSRSAWDTSADADHLETLELVDEGDMRIRTRDGDLAWKASDQPQANQECGSVGSPGLGTAKPPFSGPIDGGRNLPFGQPSSGNQQQQPTTQFNQQQPQINGGFGESSFGQPLVDNTPFDSGCLRASECWFGLALALLLFTVTYGFLFF